MGRRFICDYCDKSFPDSSFNRRNHLKGVQHQQARKVHYDKFLDPKERLDIEKGKKPCISFRNSGSCSYGALCRYSHLTVEEIQILEKKANDQFIASSYTSHLSSEGNIDNQIRLLEAKILTRRSHLWASEKTEMFRIPEGIQMVSLPPSLLFKPNNQYK
ncbi:unnamed protein product [Trichobilharzia szidati]|nr:unnamed protein product [Trichobilharzia szidati]